MRAVFATTYRRITITAVTALAAALLQTGAAAADPNQDDEFLAVLVSKQIPAIQNPPTVVAAGHKVCLKLDDGMPAQAILTGLTDDAYGMNPGLRAQPARLAATMSRFIAAAVEVYCPGDQSKIASLAARRARGPDHPFVAAVYRTTRVSGLEGVPAHRGIAGAVLGSPFGTIATGDTSPTKPPQVPSPKAPKAKTPRVAKKPPPARQAPPPQVQPPPPPQQLPPPPQEAPPPPQVQPPPPPQELPPPPQEPPSAPPDNAPAAGGPQPGAGPGASGGSGGNGGSGDGGGGGGGGGAAEPSPVQPRPPGMIQLVPWGDD